MPSRRDDVPEGFDPLGVPRAGAGRDTLIMLVALVAALAGLIVTLGWIVYYRLHTG
jgi:hypothetical protein